MGSSGSDLASPSAPAMESTSVTPSAPPAEDSLRHSTEPSEAAPIDDSNSEEKHAESARKIQKAWRARRTPGIPSSEAQSNWEEVDVQIQYQVRPRIYIVGKARQRSQLFMTRLRI